MAISTKMLPKPMLDAIKRSPKLYSLGRRLRFGIGSLLGARVVSGITGPVHFNDFMLDSNSADEARGYANSARQFVSLLGRSLEEAGRSWTEISSVLEIGCGYGRIVRELRSQQPHVDIYVNDVNEEGARFTASEFNARRISLLEAAPEPLRDRFDLVYLLSIYTHLPRDMVERSLALVCSALRPGGLAVFTIHGEGSAQMADRYDQFWLDKERVLQGLADEGYYYERYPYYRNECGLTWFAPDTIKALVLTSAPALKLVSHHAMELDGHQDIYVYHRA